MGGVRKSMHKSWLAKGLGLWLLCWGFKGVQEEIPSEEASTLQIGSAAFPPGQYTSPQLHPCHRLFDQYGHQYSPDIAPCDFWLFPKLRGCRYETIEEMKEAVTKVIDMLPQEDFHGAFQKFLERYKCIAAGGDYFEGPLHVCTSCVYFMSPSCVYFHVCTTKCPYEKNLETYRMHLVQYFLLILYFIKHPSVI